MSVHGVSAGEVRVWAKLAGRACPLRGLPPRALTEDYLLVTRRCAVDLSRSMSAATAPETETVPASSVMG